MKAFLGMFFVLIAGSTGLGQVIDQAFLPVQEWAQPKSAIMGGISDCESIPSYYGQYLQYVEALSKVVRVIYFTNSKCEAYIKSQIDTSNIQFVEYPLNSIWIRDYAPIWLQNKSTGSFVLANFPYGANYFGKQEQDDQFSSFLAKSLQAQLVLDFPRKQPHLFFDGGNLLIDEDHNCYTALRVGDGFSEDIRVELLRNINCKDVVLMNQIPEERTGHVDTFMKLLPGKRALLARYSSSPFKEAMKKNKKILLERGFQIIEIDHIDQKGLTHWSYLNSVIVGQNIFVPQYGFPADRAVVATLQKLGFIVHPIQAGSIMKERGSLHCITNFIY
ncbi:agmatine deiminase family protein [Bdellovibrio sp. HCB274]|uniref:agmatine deiminase family protein n=1 Tax=Bdellovibrio sp. HCB274 TaxID=3394361 RepID=UPI0039B4CDC2